MAQKSNTAEAAAVGAALAAAAAAGAYWLYGAEHAAKHRKLAKSWMLSARADVMEGVEKVRGLDKKKYMQIVDGVVKRYSTKASARSEEVKKLVKDLRNAWAHISKEKTIVKRKTAKVARRVSKKR